VKVGILAGGLGSRLAELTDLLPKPMVEIGDRPILWHIMKGYAARGFDEFVVALGYRGEAVKDYFTQYRTRSSNLTVKLGADFPVVHGETEESWTVHLIDTGGDSQTGGRVKRIGEFIGSEAFMLTYGDGVSDVDPRELLKFHRSHGLLATVLAVRPPARFGEITFDGDAVASFEEKPQIGEGWINGGFFVFEPGVLDYIDGDATVLEREPLEALARDRQLMAFRHTGFWQSLDTLRDRRLLEAAWHNGEAPWKVW
jgi:glucose-1-phosphate cytidylyltransferase